MKLKVKSDRTKNGLFVHILKGAFIALGVSLVGVLIFAFLLKFTSIPASVISPANQVIKAVSIFLGVFLGLRKQKEMGLVSGLLIGLAFTIIAFLTFSALDGHFTFDRTLLNDVIFGTIMGAICGIICVNIKKSSV